MRVQRVCRCGALLSKTRGEWMPRSAHERAGFRNPQHGPTSGRAVRPVRLLPNLCRRRPASRAAIYLPFVFIAAAARNAGRFDYLQIQVSAGTGPGHPPDPGSDRRAPDRPGPGRSGAESGAVPARPGPLSASHPDDVLVLAGTAAAGPAILPGRGQGDLQPAAGHVRCGRVCE